MGGDERQRGEKRKICLVIHKNDGIPRANITSSHKKLHARTTKEPTTTAPKKKKKKNENVF